MAVGTEMLMRGDVELMSRLTQWAKRAGDTIPAMKAISDLFEEKERALFESEGSSGRHGGWQPISEQTRSRKESQALYPETLRATDALYDSLTDSTAPGAIREMGPGFLRFGSSLKYAAPQQSGFTSRDGGHVPARRPVDFTLKDRAEAVAILREWITMSGKNFRVPIKPSMKAFII